MGEEIGRPLRILAVIPTSDSMSAMIFARRQMEAVSKRGHEVEIFELKSRRNPRVLLADVARYRATLRAFRPDVVQVHYGAMTGFFGVYGAFGIAPVIVTYRGSDLNPIPSMSFGRVFPSHLLSQLSALKAARIICVSEGLRDRLWWCRAKAAIIPTGVDTTKFYPVHVEEARRSLGWDRNQRVVLFNAGHSPKVKRLDIAQNAIEIARKSLDQIEFVVLNGSTPPDKVPTLMQASDCLLLTSDFEGSPTVIEEAMACNLPIVSVPVGDVPERLRDVVPSFVLPSEPKRLASAIVTILHTRPRSNGFEIAQRDVAIEPITRALESVYVGIVKAYRLH